VFKPLAGMGISSPVSDIIPTHCQHRLKEVFWFCSTFNRA